MISLSALRDHLVGDRVVFDKDGVVLDMAVSDLVGPATFLVSAITDAVKRVEADRVVGSVPRDDMWLVDAIVLDRQVLDTLGDVSLSTAELVEAVGAAGYGWEVSSTSGPSAPSR